MNPAEPHPLMLALRRLSHHLSRDFLGGSRPLRLSWVINFQKGGTALFVLLLMALYDNYSPAAWVYLALHGTYGLCWLLKHLAFPDKAWDVPVTLGGALMSFALVLGPYWVAPFLLVSRLTSFEPSWPWLALCIALHTLGVAIMMAADAQKFYTLKHRPGLITEGMFKHVRHPNYLGEMMIYASYALLVGHWLPWLVLAWVWLALFVVNIHFKEISLSRYPEWPAYKARTGLLLPKLWGYVGGSREGRGSGV